MADETTANTLGAFSDQLADVVAQAARSIVTVAARAPDRDGHSLADRE